MEKHTTGGRRIADSISKLLQIYPLSPQQFARINGPACNTSQVGQPWDDMARPCFLAAGLMAVWNLLPCPSKPRAKAKQCLVP